MTDTHKHPHSEMPDMVSRTFSTLDYDIAILVPATVAKYNELAKDTNACLNDAVLNVVYRGVLADFREKFVEALESESGIERETRDTGRKKGDEPVLEYTQTEKEYYKYVLSKTGKKPEEFAALATSVAAKCVFDPSVKERQPPGPKKIAKQYIASAQWLLDQGKQEAAAANLTQKLGREVLPTLESLSAAISEDQRKKNVASEYAS